MFVCEASRYVFCWLYVRFVQAVTTVSEQGRRRIVDEEEREEGSVSAGVYIRHFKVCVGGGRGILPALAVPLGRRLVDTARPSRPRGLC